MRRVLLLTAGLIAAACAHRTSAPEDAGPGPAPAAVTSIPELQPQPGELRAAFDLNHDGKPDLWKYSRVVGEGKEVVVRKEKDLNGDGRVDVWEAYGPDGELTKVVYDLDFDGKPDLVLTYEKGQLVRKDYAFGFDGISRTSSFYENGKLVRKERDTKNTGKVDTWEYWEDGKLDRIGFDLDGDGQVDRWESRKTAEGGATAAPESELEPVVPASVQQAGKAPAPAAKPAAKPAGTK